MARLAAEYPGNTRFERNMKYVHVSWLLFGGVLSFISLALFTQQNVSWHLPVMLPVAILALGYGCHLLIGHMRALQRRRDAWAHGVPARGTVVDRCRSSFGNFAYWRVAVRTTVAGRELHFEDRFIYPHVAEHMAPGSELELRYRPEDPEVFAFDMRL